MSPIRAAVPPDVTQLVGTLQFSHYRGRKGLFFSSSGYTPKAVAAGRDLGIELYALSDQTEWVRIP